MTYESGWKPVLSSKDMKTIGIVGAGILAIVLLVTTFSGGSDSDSSEPSPSPQTRTINTSAPTPAPRYRPPPPPRRERVVRLEFGKAEEVRIDPGSSVWVRVPDRAWVWYDPDQWVRRVLWRNGPQGHSRYFWFQPLRQPKEGERITVRIYSYNPDK